MPDLFRGDFCTPETYQTNFVAWAQQWQPDGVVADLARVREELLVLLAANHGGGGGDESGVSGAGAASSGSAKCAVAVGLAGFCWGSWATLQGCAAGLAHAVVLAHPSHRKVCGFTTYPNQ